MAGSKSLYSVSTVLNPGRQNMNAYWPAKGKEPKALQNFFPSF